jgi:Putative adhesin
MSVNPYRITALALAVTATSLTIAACGSGATTHERHSFGFGGAGLVIDDTSSDLQVVPGNGPGIEVQRWLTGTAAKPGHATWTLSGNTLRLSIDCAGLVFSCGSRFEVAVPRAVAVTINSGNNTDTVSGLSSPVTVVGDQGGVNVSGVSGVLRVSTGSGSVSATAVRSAAVSVSTDQGGVDLSFAAVPRSVEVRCSSGSATVRLPAAGHQYRVLVSSGTGSASSKVKNSPASASVVRVSSGSGGAAVLPA